MTPARPRARSVTTAARVVAAVVVFLVVVVAVGALTGLFGESPGSATPPSVPSYRITYAVQEPVTGLSSTSLVEVDRPYRARTRNYAADGTTLLGGSVWTEAATYLIDGTGAVAAVQALPPGRPGPDVRLDFMLREAVELGLVTTAGTDVVAGITCAVYGSHGPLDAMLPEPPTGDDHATACVDAAGRILREEWTVGGEVIRRREATTVDDGVALTDLELFGHDGPAPVPDALALTEVRPLAQAAATGLAVAFPPSVAGLPMDLLVEIRDLPVAGAAARSTRLTQRATYTDGVRLVILEQSRTLTGAAPPAARGDALVVEPLQGVVLGLGFGGIVVTGERGDVRVVIAGALTRAEAGALHLVVTD